MNTPIENPAAYDGAALGASAPATSLTDTTADSGAVSPVVAAAFAAGIVYMWGEAIFRLIFTYTSLPDTYSLWPGRAGDIAAMWLTISVVAIVLYFVLARLVFRGRTQVGTLKFWTIALIVSAIAAPLIGEIGTPIGI